MSSPNLDIDELIARRTSPYFTNDPYTLLGEFLVVNYQDCLFVGFKRIRENSEENIYIGIPKKDQERSEKYLAKVMDKPGDIYKGVVKNVWFFREKRKATYYTAIRLSAMKIPLQKAIEDYKIKRYWIPSTFLQEINVEFERYLSTLIDEQILKIVLFWKNEVDYQSILQEIHDKLPEAILYTFPMEGKNNAASSDKYTTRIDRIDILRWFTKRFEAWHLQPNEQFCFLVFKIPSRSANIGAIFNRMRNIAEDKVLHFKGWLGYEYTGNIYINLPPYIQIFLQKIDDCLAGFKFAVDPAEAAKSIVENFLYELVKTIKETSLYKDDDKSQKKLLSDNSILDTMYRHLIEVVNEAQDAIKREDYEGELLKPVLSDSDFETVKKKDSNRIKDLINQAQKCGGFSCPLDNDKLEAKGYIEILFYVNLFMRRILMQIPQSMNIGFAPYLMEIGFAAPDPLKDIREWGPRKAAEIEKTRISANEDAVYKILGEIEALFGIGGKHEWTSYMAPAPLYGYGQRRGFIFVVGYYRREWVKNKEDIKQRDSRLSYLCKLLRMNALYASKVLQEAKESEFRKHISDYILRTGDFRKAILENLYLLNNLSSLPRTSAVRQERKNSRKINLLIDREKIQMPLYLGTKKQLKLIMNLLLGENEIFLRSGIFFFVQCLSDVYALEEVANTIKTKVVEKERRVERDLAWKEISFAAAHQMGQPTFAIEGDLDSLNLLVKKNKQVEMKKYLSNIRLSLQRMKEHLDWFKSIAKAEKINPYPCFLKPILKESINRITTLGVDCRIECPDDLVVRGDPERLSECFDELMKNSMRWFDKEEKKIEIVVFSVPQKPLPDSLDPNQNYALIDVKDSGCGVSIPDKSKIFEAFFTKCINGTGLGLAVVRRIIEGHGGAILESGIPGKGANFKIYLPMKSKVSKIANRFGKRALNKT
jgi:signal transduction histidine kinase